MVGEPSKMILGLPISYLGHIGNMQNPSVLEDDSPWLWFLGPVFPGHTAFPLSSQEFRCKPQYDLHVGHWCLFLKVAVLNQVWPLDSLASEKVAFALQGHVGRGPTPLSPVVSLLSCILFLELIHMHAYPHTCTCKLS